MNSNPHFQSKNCVAIRLDMRALVLERRDNRDGQEPAYMVVYSCSGSWLQPHIWTSRADRNEALRQLESDKLSRMLGARRPRHHADARPYLRAAL